MQRHLESEIMSDPEQVTAFSSANRDYGIKGFLQFYDEYVKLSSGSIIDLGCGTGAYLLALEQKYPKLDITGFDGSALMIQVAQELIEARGSSVKVQYQQFNDISVIADCVMSTNTLHHLHNPIEFWNCVKRIAPKVFVMDLIRPKSETIAKDIVDVLAGNESEIFKKDYYNSLLAAFTQEELLEQIKDTNLNLVVEGDPSFLQVAIIHGIL
jgi:2-polyprenyl-3-methyl-5-hydroxy-6-metoxy-1,4-benzoquinol methylase